MASFSGFDPSIKLPTIFEEPSASDEIVWPTVNRDIEEAQDFGIDNNTIDITTYTIDNTTAPTINVPAAPAEPFQRPASTIEPAAARIYRKRKAASSEDGQRKWRKGDPPLTEEQKRENHIKSEKARLRYIQIYVDELCEVVPTLDMAVHKSHTKVFQATLEYVEEIKGDRQRLTLALMAYGVNAVDVLRNGGGVEVPAPAPTMPALSANNNFAGPDPAALENRAFIADNAVNTNDMAATANNLMDVGHNFNAADYAIAGNYSEAGNDSSAGGYLNTGADDYSVTGNYSEAGNDPNAGGYLDAGADDYSNAGNFSEAGNNAYAGDCFIGGNFSEADDIFNAGNNPGADDYSIPGNTADSLALFMASYESPNLEQPFSVALPNQNLMDPRLWYM
ncbi:MAG: hypothetical protein Q9182_002802 [Xanthomendoza sp. 2 TL-2023]